MNFHGYTSEVRYTDQDFLRFPTLFLDDGLAKPDKPVRVQRDLLYSSVTGDPGTSGYFPLNAVRWITSPREFGAAQDAHNCCTPLNSCCRCIAAGR